MPNILKLCVRSLGCKVNLADTAEVLEALGTDRVLLVDDPTEADVLLLNTCTVTHKADRDARKILGALGRDRPDLPVVVTGCAVVSSRPVLARYSNVRALLPPGDAVAVARTIAKVSGKPCEAGTEPDGCRTLGRHRATLKVQDGCDSACSYCIVPSVRGRERSLPPDEAIRRLEKLIRLGYQEVVLVGIRLGRYGAGILPAVSLADLIARAAALAKEVAWPGRIRLSSIEPMEWTPALIQAIADAGLVCPHFHVPLQSGDDGVLSRMKRPYRAEQFCAVITTLHTSFPGAALGTDVLAGFPGESEGAADITLALVRGLPLDYLHVFTFSTRPGTAAALMPGSIEPQVVRGRALNLRAHGREQWRRFMEAGVGQTHQLLVEKFTAGRLEGRSEAYRRIAVEGCQASLGALLTVAGKKLVGDRLVGVPS